MSGTVPGDANAGGPVGQGPHLCGSEVHSVTMTEPLSLPPEATLYKENYTMMAVFLTLEGGDLSRVLDKTSFGERGI